MHNLTWGGGVVLVLLAWAVWELLGHGAKRGGGSGGSRH